MQTAWAKDIRTRLGLPLKPVDLMRDGLWGVMERNGQLVWYRGFDGEVKTAVPA